MSIEQSGESKEEEMVGEFQDDRSSRVPRSTANTGAVRQFLWLT